MITPTRRAFLQDLAHRLADLPTNHPVRIGIDGVDASGKTTLANELVAPVQAARRPVIRASIDGFHRPRAERYQLGRHSPENQRYVEGQRLYLRECRPAEVASLIVANADFDAPSITAARDPFQRSRRV